jgi:TorA maturation chaperone TorD
MEMTGQNLRQEIDTSVAAGLRANALGPQDVMAVDEIDLARAREYMLLGSLIRQAPSQELLSDIAKLKGDATPLGLLHLSLADAADETDVHTESREYFRMFVGVGRGELLPYASYYLTGFLHERPLARVREDLARLGIERAAGLAEPEDNLGILFDVMAGLILDQFGAGPDAAQAFFDRHLKAWAARVFTDLESCKPTLFYRAVARVGAAFIDIETEGFSLPA